MNTFTPNPEQATILQLLFSVVGDSYLVISLTDNPNIIELVYNGETINVMFTENYISTEKHTYKYGVGHTYKDTKRYSYSEYLDHLTEKLGLK